MQDFIPLVRRSYQAYADKDRPALEALITDDFHFTSPLDNRIGRAVYFDRCWPNSQTISDFQFVHLGGDQVFVTDEAHGTALRGFRNPKSDHSRRQDRRGGGLFRLDNSARGAGRLSCNR